jgi:hypothetical protein
MPRKLAVAMAAAVALAAALHDGAASAGSLDGFSTRGSGYGHGLAGHSGAASGSGASSGSGALARPSSSGYIGAGHRYDLGHHQGSGWYQRGFGGNLNPGWGYGFGPQLGGPGH